MSRGRTDELMYLLCDLQNAMVMYAEDEHADALEYLKKTLQQTAKKHQDADTRKRAATFCFRDGRDLFTMYLLHPESRVEYKNDPRWTALFWEFCIISTLPHRERLRTLARTPLILLPEKDPEWRFGDFDKSVYMHSLTILSEQYLGDC